MYQYYCVHQFHEIAHMMGITHVDDSNKLMNPLCNTYNIDQNCMNGVSHVRHKSENLACQSESILPYIDSDCITTVSEEYVNQNITILPNPSLDGLFRMKHTEIHLDDEIRIYNTRGEQVQYSVNGNTIKLDNAPSGIYFISIYRNESIYYAGKIIVI